MLGRVWRRGSIHALLAGMHTGTAPLEAQYRGSSKKQNIQTLYDLIIPPLGMYPQGIGINSKGQ